MASELDARATLAPADESRLSSADYLVGFAFFLSGVLALVYEMCWIRSAQFVFGATTQAVSTVIAIFFGGLALGSWYFGRMARRSTRPLRMYAVLEIAIGVLALASPWLLSVFDSLLRSMYDSVQDSPIKLLSVRCLMVTAVILPPTILMGGSLPLFVRHYVRADEHIARPIGWLYALNTFGAAAGCLLCGLLLLPTLGMTTSIYAAAAINIALGAIVFAVPLTAPEIDLTEEDEDGAEDEEEEVEDEEEVETQEDAERLSADQTTASPEDDNASQARSEDKEDELDEEDDDEEYDEDDWSLEINESKVVAWMFFFSGFAVLGYEVLWTRFLALVTTNTIYTYTFTLAIVLLGMGFGTVLISRRLDQSDRRAFQFAIVQAGIGISTLIIMLLPVGIWGYVDHPESVWGQLLIVSLLLGLPSLLIGMSFPIAIRMVVGQMKSASSEVGRLVALNTVGGICGSLLVGFVLLTYLSMQHTLRLLTVINVLISITTLMLLEDKLSQAKRGIIAIVQALIWIGVPFLFRTELPKTYLVGNRPLGPTEVIIEGSTSNIAVVFAGPGIKKLEIDGMWQGSTELNHQVVAAHVPAILHPKPSSVLVVGLGAGQTAKAFLAHSDVETLDVVEIERRLIGIVRDVRYLGDNSWMDGNEKQKVNVFAEDGRSYLTHSKATYDIISIEVGQVFRPSIGNFYTQEFYSRASERLNDGGLICQFVPLNFLRPEDFKRVVATFRETFPNSLLWYNTSELLMIGTNADKFQVSRQQLEALTKNARVKQDLEQAYWGGPAEYLNRPEIFLGGFLTGPRGLANISADTLLLTDAIPSMEYLKRPDESDFMETIYGILAANKEDVRQILTFQPTAIVLNKSAEVQESNLRHLVANKYLEYGNAMFEQVTLKFAQIRQALSVGQSQAAQRMREEALGELPEVIGYLQQAKNRLVRFAPIYLSLGKAYAAQENFPVAAEMFQTGLAINPKDATLYRNFGEIMMSTGNVDAAISLYRESIKYNKLDAALRSTLASALAARPDHAPGEAEEALKLAKEAIQIRGENPPHPTDLDVLGMALAASGQYDQAAEVVQNAIDIGKQFHNASAGQLEPFRLRLALYKSKRPFIQNRVPNQGTPQGSPGMNPQAVPKKDEKSPSSILLPTGRNQTPPATGNPPAKKKP